MMKQKSRFYFIIYPLITFLVYTLYPILFHKKEHTSMKDILGMIVTYYILISGYYFIDFLSERIKKNGKEKQ
ncbi:MULTISPECIES: hypothetical protein [Bacillus]|uniref:Group-specific protein n=1 Tax=Bacillus toyonensis TaxID=155322 RepID=A0A2C5MLS1_9BACI|nr:MULTISPECIES: hypothetical protein [Bacillus]EOP28857.1 hypothetical protein IIS_00330 [Bacillus cereus VD131]MDP9744510.1 putative membrane protein [Bacillus thuringiensis]OTW93612.1 hypothetical protein BK702_04230 [Bacillus thuringiensis serovar cameroun]OTX06143.1 hypothetical protein BK712_17210 [Bacillus thuringiensis serovar seoulensis]OTX30489.1 hypothetical protein BK717_26050 [Bacillus thuringiensis serovar malayensis]OUB03018.1 hypothetical protein BK709_23555 [Bacillus thuringi